MRLRWRVLLVALVGVASFWLGRQSLPELRDRITAPSPREEYARQLESAGLMDAALGRLWVRAASRAVAEAPRVDAPFRETGYLDPSRPDAVGYRFSARAGERLMVEVELEPPTNALVFMDVYRVPSDSMSEAVPVVSADSGERVVVFEPRDGDYVVRVQPELLRGGRYTLTVVAEPTMAFPVEGAGPRAVRSYFGDPRDGGSRDHHGIDIFAPRNTPVVAAVAGRVSSVRTTPIGGRVVWLRDERRGQSVYYAHLEAQTVERGQRVRPGDTLGLVGNSGNARSTPPHLHFGIYRRGLGPLDPLPFVEPRSNRPAPPSLPPDAAGSTRRVTDSSVVLRAAPREDAASLGELEAQAPVRVSAIAGDWLRIEVADGRRGFVLGSLTSLASPLRTAALDSVTFLRETPLPGAARVARLDAGETVEVLGRLGDHLYVRARSREAWLPVARDG